MRLGGQFLFCAPCALVVLVVLVTAPASPAAAAAAAATKTTATPAEEVGSEGELATYSIVHNSEERNSTEDEWIGHVGPWEETALLEISLEEADETQVARRSSAGGPSGRGLSELPGPYGRYLLNVLSSQSAEIISALHDSALIIDRAVKANVRPRRARGGAGGAGRRTRNRSIFSFFDSLFGCTPNCNCNPTVICNNTTVVNHTLPPVTTTLAPIVNGTTVVPKGAAPTKGSGGGKKPGGLRRRGGRGDRRLGDYDYAVEDEGDHADDKDGKDGKDGKGGKGGKDDDDDYEDDEEDEDEDEDDFGLDWVIEELCSVCTDKKRMMSQLSAIRKQRRRKRRGGGRKGQDGYAHPVYTPPLQADQSGAASRPLQLQTTPGPAVQAPSNKPQNSIGPINAPPGSRSGWRAYPRRGQSAFRTPPPPFGDVFGPYYGDNINADYDAERSPARRAREEYESDRPTSNHYRGESASSRLGLANEPEYDYAK